MNDLIVKEVWGCRTSSWLALPSWGASGGILVIWDENKLEVLEHELGAFSVAIRCKVVEEEEWVFVGVYGPLNSGEVDDFLSELDNVLAR